MAITNRNMELMITETMMYSSSSQLGLGSVSAHVASMWYGSDAFSTNTNSEPPHVTNFSSRMTRDDVKSGVNSMVRSFEVFG